LVLLYVHFVVFLQPAAVYTIGLQRAAGKSSGGGGGGGSTEPHMVLLLKKACGC
jgi:hypothetical protein